MKVLYFDCFSGISGDMTLGALMDLGVDKAAFLAEMEKLGLGAEYQIEINRVVKSGISGTDIKVMLHEGDDGEVNEPESQQGEAPHAHSAAHHGHHTEQAGHEHHHEQHHEHHHAHNSAHGRNLQDITGIISRSALAEEVKAFSIRVFEEIARAEAHVHAKPIEQVHFHEVGAIDSIVDIVGVGVCLHLLGVEAVYSSPLHEGTGTIRCRHGLMPVPVPAVMEMLRDSNIPLISEDIHTELVTPTGLGIIKILAAGFGSMPSLAVKGVGYGMGKRDTGRFNALRVVLGEAGAEKPAADDNVVLLEANLDDMSPEILAFSMDRLFDAGALDVFYTPIYMKKNRPAVMLSVLCKAQHEQMLTDILFRETTTLGVRRSLLDRSCMERRWLEVETPAGKVRVKLAAKGDIQKLAPEFEDCRKLAVQQGVPLQQIYHWARVGAEKLLERKEQAGAV